MTQPRSLGRRTFLYTTAGAALATPFLQSVSPTPMRAQDMVAPRRFIAIQSYSGQIAQQWYPTATPAGYRLRDSVLGDPSKADGTTYLHERLAGTPVGRASLTDFAGMGGLSRILGPELDPHLPKMNLLRGIDFLSGCGHGYGAYLGNYGACAGIEATGAVSQIPTIDQVMAYSPRFYPSDPILRSLDVATGGTNTSSFTHYGVPGGAIEQVDGLVDPRAAWDRAFGRFMSPELPTESPNRLLLNAIHEDYSRLTRSRRISTEDRQLLERHVAFLADIERRLTSISTPACEVPAPPRAIENLIPRDVSSVADLDESARALVDVCVAALRCDITRVVTFKVQKAITDASGAPRGSYHESGDVAGDWHQFAHSVGDGVSENHLLAIHQWTVSRVFQRFIEGLDGAPDLGGSTVLDNSLVVWGNELGYEHAHSDVQTVTAGGAGGSIRTGQYLDFIDWSHDYASYSENWGVNIPGLPHNRWLVSMLRAMGLEASDYEASPGAGYGSTERVEVGAWPGNRDMHLIAEPLPGVMV